LVAGEVLLMAGDWIKMRTDLYRDPKVIAMAELLLDKDSPTAGYVNQNLQRDMAVTRNVMRNAVVGALVSVWGVMRHQGKRIDDDLVSTETPLWALDDIADLHGFGDAMATAGWVVDTEESLVFPRFFSEHNVDPNETAKDKNRERQKRFRESKRNALCNVTDNVTVTVREEKRREDLPPPLTPPENAVEVAELVKELRADPYALRYAEKAVSAAVKRGVPTSELRSIADFWKASGANSNGKPAPWDRPDLYERIRNAMPGEQPDKHWPPAGSWQTREKVKP